MIVNRIKKFARNKIDRYRNTSKYMVRRQIDNYLKSHHVAMVQIGCGRNFLSGWLNTDTSMISCKMGAVYMDARKPYPIPDKSIDYIFSEHLFEHLTYPQAVNMLGECRRVLRPHGIIRIATPNLQFLIDLYQNPEKTINRRYIEWSCERIHGGQFPVSSGYAINKFHTSYGHKIIYDPAMLAAFLKQFGFEDICRCEISKSKHDDLINVERHQTIIPPDFCQLETMIFEARKG